MIFWNGRNILSVEGTTQGDNLAMSFHALGNSPIIENLRTKIPQVKNASLADDITGAGKLEYLKTWWETVISEGGKYGYNVNESKSWLITKNPDLLQED